ncbi:MAG: class I poly(R)-hydroxyalkanoic acid synthase, partial [Gammaproteobacteria bacterium]
TTFNMLRANDLIWSFVINNYLLGRQPMAFDLLYWNSDSTRMPARMHSTYLRKMYLENAFREPGGISIDGTPIDLRRIDVPACFVSAVEDHIAPWKSTFAGARLLSGPVKFILGQAGHVAGIINPPGPRQYGYFQGPEVGNLGAEEWFAQATLREESWWAEWGAWVGSQGGDKVPAREPGTGALPALEDAPGSYVSKRITRT